MTLALEGALAAAGFTPAERVRRLALFRAAEAALRDAGAAPVRFDHVPGRIELLGKHTDYAGGRSLVCATEQGFAIVAAPRTDDRLRVIDALRREAADFPLDPELVADRERWINYPMTVAARLARDFGPGLRGLDLAFASDVPYAAGVSSSSALVVGTARAVIARNLLERTARWGDRLGTIERVAGYFGAVENGRPFGDFAAAGGVGTLGGNQDQTAILGARSGAVTQYRFDPVTREAVVLWPGDLALAIGTSGVVAEKTGAARERYNALARLTARLAAIAGETARGLTLGEVLNGPDPVPAEAVAARLARHPDPAERAWLAARFAQLAAECRTIIPGVARALTRGDRSTLGELVAASQAAAVSGLANQIPETVALVDLARAEGAVAASAFGAGFGGSVWAAVPAPRAEAFLAAWRAAYQARFPARDAAFLPTRPAPPATELIGHSSPAA